MRVSRRGRGRPCKIPYEDFPEEGTAEGKKKWKNKKNPEEWRYKKLTSDNADDYREKEKEHVSWYVSEKRQDIIGVAHGESTIYKHVMKRKRLQKAGPKKRVEKGKKIRKINNT